MAEERSRIEIKPDGTLTDEELAARLKRPDEFQPLPLQAIPTEPPQTPGAKPVDSIEGKPIAEWERNFQRDQQVFQDGLLSEDEKKKAIENENKMLQLEDENRDWRAGIKPLRIIAKYKMQIGIGGLLAAVASFFLKC